MMYNKIILKIGGYSMSNKLELTWYGKENKLKVEPRILIENKELSNIEHDVDTENMLIHGDNLLALKSLEGKYAGKVKCIYIDPPYNTGSAFEHYDDNVEHSIWLNLMKTRLEILKNLLADEGFFCCQIDDSEGHYLKVMLDEIFGRNNYLTTLYIRVRYPEKTLKEDMQFHKEIEQIHVYRKSRKAIPNLREESFSFDKFKFFITELGKPIDTIVLGGKKVEIFDVDRYKIEKGEGSDSGLKEIWATGTILEGNSSGRFFRDYLSERFSNDGYGMLYKVYGIGDDKYDYRYFTGPKRIGATKGKYYQGVPVNKLSNNYNVKKKPINSFYDFAANFGNCRHEGDVGFRGGKKPEILLDMIYEFFSDDGDIILDSFLGSGTSVAVAHKMNRKWIGIEMGNHVYTHCKVRVDKVIRNEDDSGITKKVNWQGGGGYKFYELAPSLINIDDFGEPIINKEYDADMLASAVALHEGFDYQPSNDIFWKQSMGNENSYLFVTTRHLTMQYINSIKDTMEDNEFLVIACRSYDAGVEKAYKQITIKKIPNMLLTHCEFDKDNYNLNIINPPVYSEWEEDESDE